MEHPSQPIFYPNTIIFFLSTDILKFQTGPLGHPMALTAACSCCCCCTIFWISCTTCPPSTMSCCCVRHSSHHAAARAEMGLEWASNAGSSLPRLPSLANISHSKLPPAVEVPAALFTVHLRSTNFESAIPAVSIPYAMLGIAVARTAARLAKPREDSRSNRLVFFLKFCCHPRIRPPTSLRLVHCES